MAEQNRIASHICRQLCEGDNRAAPCCHEAGNGKTAYGARKKEEEEKRTNEQQKGEGERERKKEKRTDQEQKILTRTNITQYALQVNLFSESFSISNHSSLSSLPKCKRLIPSVWGKFSLSKIFGTDNSRICPVQCLQNRAIKLALVNIAPMPNLPF